MFANQAEKALALLISIGGFLTTITVITWRVNDPVNAPKLLILGTVTGGALFFTLKNKGNFFHFRELRSLHLIVFSFLVLALVSIFFSESSVANGFYGTYGRNTGFLAYFCLAILLIASAQLQTPTSIKTVLNALFYAGIFNIVYFILSQMGIEIFAWNNSFERILGTFGNPNFIGAFMGIFIILCTSRLVEKSTTLRWRLSLIVLILISLMYLRLMLLVN